MQSSEKELEDVATLLAHYYPGVPKLTKDDHEAIADKLGYINCAALNIILRTQQHA
jgi:hypothetical protein